MAFLEDSDRSNYTSFEMQDFIKDGDFETAGNFEESFTDGNDPKGSQSSLVESAFKTLNNYCRAQGVIDDDVVYWDGQVREMMESVKRIREALPLRSKVDNVFHFCDGDLKKGNVPLTEEGLKASIAEIEKMDVVLKLKINEEKQAKLSRIQTEEESRDILTKFPYFEGSTGIKSNFEEFLKLLNDVENSEGHNQQAEEEKNEKKNKEEKREKLDCEQKAGSRNIVERNIRLAKCGRGTLSITDEEKSRLDGLLVDLKNPPKSAEEIKESEESDAHYEGNVYGIDCETKCILSQIDQRLEMLRSTKLTPPFDVGFLEKSQPEGKSSDEDEKQTLNKGRKREKSPTRLETINKLLHSMNSISKEEIKPLSEKELSNLIQQSKKNLTRKITEENGTVEEFEWMASKPPKNVVEELVSNAKLLMPRFKYRFQNS